MPGRGRELLLGVLGVEPGLDRVAELGRRLALEPAAGGDVQLQLDDVEAGRRLGDRVLDLQPGVDLEEGEQLLVGLVEELDRAGADVAGRLDQRLRRLAQRARPARGVSAGELDSSITFWLRRCTEQSRTPGAHTLPCWSAMTCTSMCRPPSTSRSMKTVGSPKRALRLDLRALERLVELVLGPDDPDAAPAAAAAGLDDERVADGRGVPARRPRRSSTGPPLHGATGHAGLLGQHLGLDLGAEQAHRLGRRADERDAERGAQLGERRVLGDEAPADPGGVGAALPQRPAELLVVEVGVARRRCSAAATASSAARTNVARRSASVCRAMTRMP